MKLNRNNYEEYFILYLDNELSSEERREVEIFAQENPDLKAELNMLLQSKLTPDTDITYTNKELLMIRNSSSISIANHEEWLLSYIDNELTEEERKDVERFVAGNPAVQTELNLLQKVKLQPEAIVFPFKDSLYHKEEKAHVVAIRWWRIAAAAVLLLGISTTAIVLINNKQGSKQDDIVSGKSKEVKTTIDKPAKQPGKVAPVNQEAIVNNDQKKNESAIKENNNPLAIKEKNNSGKEKNTPPVPVKIEEPIVKRNNEKQPSNNLPQPTAENRYLHNQIKPEKTIVVVPPNKSALTDSALTKNKENIEYAKVTEEVPQPSYAIERSSGNKGLRGFFRKVTRTIEKRTSIKATDDDGRLLIAGLAIKMN